MQHNSLRSPSSLFLQDVSTRSKQFFCPLSRLLPLVEMLFSVNRGLKWRENGAFLNKHARLRDQCQFSVASHISSFPPSLHCIHVSLHIDPLPSSCIEWAASFPFSPTHSSLLQCCSSSLLPTQTCAILKICNTFFVIHGFCVCAVRQWITIYPYLRLGFSCNWKCTWCYQLKVKFAAQNSKQPVRRYCKTTSSRERCNYVSVPSFLLPSLNFYAPAFCDLSKGSFISFPAACYQDFFSSVFLMTGLWIGFTYLISLCCVCSFLFLTTFWNSLTLRSI